MTVPEPYASQAENEVRFEWGLNGLQAMAGDDPVAIVVDVLSFSTAVSVAVSAGGIVVPFRWGMRVQRPMPNRMAPCWRVLGSFTPLHTRSLRVPFGGCRAGLGSFCHRRMGHHLFRVPVFDGDGRVPA
jgi:hypothetical protein